METLYCACMASPIGKLTVVVSERGLVAIELGERHAPEWIESPEKTAACLAQLQEYFAGERREFDLPLDLRGTEFQQRCWQALLEIPYGRTASYGDIARAVGCPRGFRAVGLANHSNPIPIVVPCHRVLGADGSLTGYGGGLEIKRKLLEMEGALLKTARASTT